MKDYKEILKGVVNIINTTEKSDIGFANICTYIGENCPELKENEDEKNIKNLIDELKCSLRAANCQNEACNGGHEKRIALLEWAIAWLEKQGKQILANSAKTCKVEPKFKVGDIMRTLQEASDNITSGLPIIVSIDKEYYHCTNELIAIRDQDGYEYPPMNRIQKPAWTIQDANDGDVLVDVYGNIGIYEKCGDYDWTSYCSLGCYGGFQNFLVPHEIDKTHPATKEERDTLFEEMKKEGYEWDAEKRELRKIAQNNNEETNEGNFDIAGLYYAQNILEKTLGKVEGYQSDDGILEHKSAINAVTKLYDKISRGTSINWKPSDEQITAFEHFVRSIGESDFASPYDSNTKLVYSLLSDLKKLKEK